MDTFNNTADRNGFIDRSRSVQPSLMESPRKKMAFRVRSSKFRHVFGSAVKKEQCYDCIKITKNAHDSNYCAVNPKFLAIVTESAGGGAFLVLPLERTGRVDINASRVCGHSGPVLDVKWNPFNDNLIASCSDDATIKIWQIPDGGLKFNQTEWLVDLHGHSRRVGCIEWHPTADNILLSGGFDFKCILWNTETAEPVNIIDVHRDTIFSISWNRDGSLFATTSKDKKLRVIDPRKGTVVAEGAGHQGSKSSKVVFTGKDRLFTTGFSRTSERQYGVWAINDLSKPLRSEGIDSSSGILFPYYDFDSKVVFVAGKGDGNIRYYELVEDAPYIHYLSQFQTGTPQRGLGMMSKRGVNTSKCEIARFYKLHAVKGMCEPISMIVPRKSEMFHEDIFIPTASACPSLSAEEWINGQDRDPILVSLKDGAVSNTPTITTYKAVKRQVSGGTTGSSLYDLRQKRQGAPPPVATVQPSSPSRLPSSLRNINKLSFDNSYVTIENNNNVSGEGKSQEKTSDKIEDLEKKARVSLTKETTRMTNSNEPLTVDKKVWANSYTDPEEIAPASNGVSNQSEIEISPQASPPPRQSLRQKNTTANTTKKVLSPKSSEQRPKDKSSDGSKGSKLPGSPAKKLVRQNTDVNESDSSEIFATPPDSPAKESSSSAVKSPVTWSSNPLYKKNQSSSGNGSATRLPSRSQSLRSTVGSSSPSSFPTQRKSLRSTAKSSSVDSSTGIKSPLASSKSTSSSTSGSRLASPNKRVNSVNKSSVFSQQNSKNGTEPPCPPTRKDSIAKARKNSRKLDTENMLYGSKEAVLENGDDKNKVERSDSFNKENRPKETKIEIQNESSESSSRKRTISVGSSNEEEIPVNGKISISDRENKDKVSFSTETESKDSKNYLDGFLMDAPDNTLIKPSKLRESMRKNRARRAQTAPVDRGDVDKALEEIDRKWGKPDRSLALSHLPLADRLAFRKMRTEREQNNNEINRLLKKEMSSNSGVNKVLTTSTSSNVPGDNGMSTPVNDVDTSGVFESPAITPILHLSNASTSPIKASHSPPQSPKQIETKAEPLYPKPDSQVTPKQNQESVLKEAGAGEPGPVHKRLQNGRSQSLDDHRVHVKKVWSPSVSSPCEKDSHMENGMPQTDPELRKAYFRQVEEIRSLKEQLKLKDHRIRQLEEEVNVLREDKDLAGESNC